MSETQRSGIPIVISAASGTGKTSLCDRLLMTLSQIERSTSYTTRSARGEELDGVHYHFVSNERFDDMIAAGEFIEYAEVYGNMYGTMRGPMEDALAAGKLYLLEIDVQGALQLRAMGVPGTYIFVAPPNFEELRKRLMNRGSETPEMLERRLHKAEDEYRERVKYDHVVVNDDLERAVTQIQGLMGLGPGG